MTNIMRVGATINAKETITSLELVEQINVFREQEGNRAVLQHSDLLKVIRDEFEEEIGIGQISETSYIHPQNGQEYPMFELTLNQAKQILVRESKFVRKAVIAYIDKLENKLKEGLISLPNFNNPAEAARAWALEYEAKQQALLEAKKANEHVQRLTHDAKTYTTSEIAKELNLKSANQLNKILEKEKVQYKLNNTWLLYSNYADKDYVSIKQQTLDNGKIIYDRRWKSQGRDFILDLLKEKCHE